MTERSSNAKVREAMVSGIFYPEDPVALSGELAALLSPAPAAPRGALAIVSPHAGFSYSGDLSALAWASASGRDIRDVLVICPLHRPSDPAVYLPEAAAFQTPLGFVDVNSELVEELHSCSTLFTLNDIPHFEEHGIEVQLPFMKRLFPEARLAPIIIAGSSVATIRSVAGALGACLADRIDKTLIVVSANMASSPSADEAKAKADDILRLVAGGSWQELAASEEGCLACGTACLATLLALPWIKDKKPVILGRHDSSPFRQTEAERFVQYAAIAYV